MFERIAAPVVPEIVNVTGTPEIPIAAASAIVAVNVTAVVFAPVDDSSMSEYVTVGATSSVCGPSTVTVSTV